MVKVLYRQKEVELTGRWVMAGDNLKFEAEVPYFDLLGCLTFYTTSWVYGDELYEIFGGEE